MGKPVVLAFALSLLALPLACGDDDDDNDGGAEAGEGGSGDTGGRPGGGTAGRAGSGGRAGSAGQGGNAGEGGSGGSEAGSGGGGAGGAGAAGGGGAGGAGGDLGDQFAATAALICETVDSLDCDNEANCQSFREDGYGNAACLEDYRNYLDCVSAQAVDKFECTEEENAELSGEDCIEFVIPLLECDASNSN